MKWLIFAVGIAAGLGLLWAAEPGPSEATNAPPPVEGAAKAASLSDADAAVFARLKKAQFELSTKIAVLSELAEEHAGKSENKTEPPQKADWEKQLTRDLRDKVAAATKELGVVAKQVSAFETAHGIVGPPTLVFSALRPAGALGPDDLIYLSSLQDRLFRVQQDLTTALDTGSAYSLELLTNNTPENVARISLLNELNGREVRDLEREQADLELRKLEFRALKK